MEEGEREGGIMRQRGWYARSSFRFSAMFDGCLLYMY